MAFELLKDYDRGIDRFGYFRFLAARRFQRLALCGNFRRTESLSGVERHVTAASLYRLLWRDCATLAAASVWLIAARACGNGRIWRRDAVRLGPCQALGRRVAAATGPALFRSTATAGAIHAGKRRGEILARRQRQRHADRHPKIHHGRQRAGKTEKRCHLFEQPVAKETRPRASTTQTRAGGTPRDRAAAGRSSPRAQRQSQRPCLR